MVQHTNEQTVAKWLSDSGEACGINPKRAAKSHLLGKRNSSSAEVISVHRDWALLSGWMRTTGNPRRRISIKEWTARRQVVCDVQSYLRLSGSRKHYPGRVNERGSAQCRGGSLSIKVKQTTYMNDAAEDICLDNGRFGASFLVQTDGHCQTFLSKGNIIQSHPIGLSHRKENKQFCRNRRVKAPSCVTAPPLNELLVKKSGNTCDPRKVLIGLVLICPKEGAWQAKLVKINKCENKDGIMALINSVPATRS